MKAVASPVAPDSGDAEGAVVELVTQEQLTTPKRKQGSERAISCPPHCSHSASLPSDILIEMKVRKRSHLLFSTRVLRLKFKNNNVYLSHCSRSE